MPEITINIWTTLESYGHTSITYDGKTYGWGPKEGSGDSTNWYSGIDGDGIVRDETDLTLDNRNIIISRPINITDSGYSSIGEFIKAHPVGYTADYGAFGSNCYDFVNSMLREAGAKPVGDHFSAFELITPGGGP